MIEFFANKLDPEPLRQYQVKEQCTLHEWLQRNVRTYSAETAGQVSIEVAGALVHHSVWGETQIGPSVEVRIWREPKGTDPISITIAAIKGLQAVMKLFMPRIKMPKSGSPNQGDPLDGSKAKANSVKFGDIVREAAGRNRIYPDYIVPPRRRFVNPREEWVQMLLCLGKGEFQIDPADIKIGDTPLISLGSRARYAIFQPGQNVSGDPASVWWHTVEEVGATATGTAGIDLTVTTAVEQNATAQQYLFSGNQVSVPSGAGSLPTGWAAGMIVRAEAQYQYTVTSGTGVGGRDTISGPLAQLGAFPGMKIEVVGDNAGYYVVNSYTAPAGSTPAQMTLNTTGGAPVTGLKSGVGWAAIGYMGLRFRIAAATTSTLTLGRLTDTGATDGAWPGFDTLSTNSAVLTLDSSNTDGDWSGPFFACPSAERATAFEYDVMFPNGLGRINKEGQLQNYAVTYEVQWRDSAIAGGWSSYSETFTNKTLNQLGYTRQINLPYPMVPEVRMRRIGANSEKTDISDDIQWYGLRALLPSPSAYQGVTVIAIDVAGGGKLGAQSENQISVIATRKLQVLEGGSWTADRRPTRDIIPWMRHIALSVGYTDADLDQDEMVALDGLWKFRSDTFDYIIDSASTVKDCISDVLAAGFAEQTNSRGLLRPVRDQLRQGVDHNYTSPAADGEVWMYSAQNMTGSLSRQFTAPAPDDTDGIDVEYVDGKTWQVETVKCRLPGDAGQRVEKVTAVGITDRNRAYRMGMRRRCEQRYRRWTYSFPTELDANNSEYMSLAGVSDDIPGSGQSAFLKSFAVDGFGTILESSEPLDWAATPVAQVALRKQDGRVSGPWPATRIDDYRLRIPPLDFTPDVSWQRDPPHILFGRIRPVLVTTVDPSGLESCSVKGVNYDERVYQYDNAIADN
ncbi:host specificity factor TipJ family phage tail protein [Pseudomonas denitrificans (nom. rej.)]|nr:host specificity factor TipJ family phage tail protein [Pseudomonas denitrificans (nom. rej.)]